MGVFGAISVLDLIRLVAPRVEAGHGFVGEQAVHGQGALRRWASATSLIQEGVVEAGGGCVRGGVAIEDGVAARPVERGEAHRAGFAAGVDVAAVKLEAAESLAGGADGDDLGVGGGVVGCGDLIDAGGDDLPPWTTTAPKGPPLPEVTLAVARAIACRMNVGSPSMACLRSTRVPALTGKSRFGLWRIIAIMAQAFVSDRVVTAGGNAQCGGGGRTAD